jgi:hypothetical protein
MPTHKTAKELARQVGDLLGDAVTFITKLFFSLNEQQLRWLASHKKQLFNALRSAILTLVGNVHHELLSEWERFYKEVWEIEVDFSSLFVPASREGFNGFVVMFQGMTPNRIFAKWKERFGCWRYTEDLDSNIQDPPRSVHSYAIWCRDRVEADEEHKNKSANDCQRKGLNIMNAQERMMLELFYNWKTGKHLDTNTLTLTSSRTRGGDAVGVRWDAHDSEVYVNYCSPVDRGDGWRSREVVS